MKWSLKKWCIDRDYILFLLGINSGLRVSDMLKIKVEEIKDKKKITILEGKTKKKRIIYLSIIYDELNNYISTLEDTVWLFPSRKGNKPIGRIQAYNRLVHAAKMVDINEGIGTHTMRKTFGYWHYKQFKDIAALQKILNHSHPQITLNYIGITNEQIETDMQHFYL